MSQALTPCGMFASTWNSLLHTGDTLLPKKGSDTHVLVQLMQFLTDQSRLVVYSCLYQYRWLENVFLDHIKPLEKNTSIKLHPEVNSGKCGMNNVCIITSCQRGSAPSLWAVAPQAQVHLPGLFLVCKVWGLTWRMQVFVKIRNKYLNYPLW